jgi:hypothetical protein
VRERPRLRIRECPDHRHRAVCMPFVEIASGTPRPCGSSFLTWWGSVAVTLWLRRRPEVKLGACQPPQSVSAMDLATSPTPPRRRLRPGKRKPLVVSSLVSSVYVRLRSLVFGLMRRCRSRTLTVFGELLSRLLKIGRSAVRPRPWPPPLAAETVFCDDLLLDCVQLTVQFGRLHSRCWSRKQPRRI